MARVESDAHAPGDEAEALLDLGAEGLAHTRKLLSEPSEETAEVALAAVLLFDRAEEAPHALERRLAAITQERVERAVHLQHVEVDAREAELLLGPEVVIEGALRDLGRLEQRLDAEVVVAALEEHGHARLEQAISGRFGRHASSIGPNGLDRLYAGVAQSQSSRLLLSSFSSR